MVSFERLAQVEHVGHCPDAVRKGDWPATCKLNTKTCIMESNPPQECEYYQDYLKEMEEMK